jgi:hypothetical protein
MGEQFEAVYSGTLLRQQQTAAALLGLVSEPGIAEAIPSAAVLTVVVSSANADGLSAAIEMSSRVCFRYLVFMMLCLVGGAAYVAISVFAHWMKRTQTAMGCIPTSP